MVEHEGRIGFVLSDFRGESKMSKSFFVGTAILASIVVTLIGAAAFLGMLADRWEGILP